MRTNVKTRDPTRTYEGGQARTEHDNGRQLRRMVACSFLWEDQFYVDGKSHAEAIYEVAKDTPLPELARVACEVRQIQNNRHMGLFLGAITAARGSGFRSLVASAVSAVVLRADEIAEFIALYAKIRGKTGKTLKPLSKGVVAGLAFAFNRFDEYQFSKWNRDGDVTLRDALFLVRPVAKSAKQKELFDRIAEGKLQTADTWEARLSSGKGKKETFEQLIRAGKLGYMALLRNLRNMNDVPAELVKEALLLRKGAQRVLPFRFLTAARMAPQFAETLNEALTAHTIDQEKVFGGKTVIIVDCSASMNQPLSEKSIVRRRDVAGVLAGCFPGSRRLFAFGHECREVMALPGLGSILSLDSAHVGHATFGGAAVDKVRRLADWDRMIVITDEQFRDYMPSAPCKNAYIINVAGYKNGVGFANWTTISGWSDNVFRFIEEIEKH